MTKTKILQKNSMLNATNAYINKLEEAGLNEFLLDTIKQWRVLERQCWEYIEQNNAFIDYNSEDLLFG